MSDINAWKRTRSGDGQRRVSNAVNVSQNAPRISIYGNGSRKRLRLWGKALATEKHNVNEFVDIFKSRNGSITGKELLCCDISTP